MSKAFVKNKKLNKIMKNINKNKNKKIAICMRTGETFHTTIIDYKNLVKSSLKDKFFKDYIDSNDETLHAICNEYYAIFKLWSAFNTNYYTMDEFNDLLYEDALDKFIKAKNGDEYSLSYINSLISTYYILCIYFDIDLPKNKSNSIDLALAI